MTPETVCAPVVLVLFNRPEPTARVFERIAAARPRRLLIVADGPRPDVPADIERCAAARAVVERIDWDCDVSRDYASTNLGCGRRMASGLDWVFSTVDRAIILEDDCLPDPSFFRFMSDMLERYAEHERVLHVAGTSVEGRAPAGRSYFFSLFPWIWGWATWRRAWRHYDRAMTDWPERRASGWLQALWRGEEDAAAYWRSTFDLAHSQAMDTWDLQWMYACWRVPGLSIIPAVNLISNLGVTGDATHTWDTSMFAPLAHRATEPMPATLIHPTYVARHPALDLGIQQNWASVCPMDKVHEIVVTRKGAAHGPRTA